MNRDYVVCPALITGPALTQGMIALGLTPSMPCALECPVVKEAELMEFRCARGHTFRCGPEQIQRAES